MIWLAIALTVYLYLSVGLEPLIAPIILIVGALASRMYVFIRPVQEDPHIDQRELYDIIQYSMLGLLALAVGNLVADGLFQPPIPASVADLAVTFPLVTSIFLVLMAISEEVFFRGEFQSLITSRSAILRPGAIGFSAAFFSVYHLQVYGSSLDSIIYVFLGGLVLSWTAWKTRRLATPTIAHVINNVVGSIYLIPLIIGIVVLIGILALSRRRRSEW